MGFRPKEILFSPTADCNLSCPHCANEKSKVIFSKNTAIKFLRGSKRIGIKRVGFTGGEPFLALNFLCGIVAAAVKEGFLFDRIMTNAVWYRDESHLRRTLARLFESGYDGSICVSVDAFHKQDLKKIARFIKMACALSGRPDIISIAYVAGSRESETLKMLRNLGGYLHGKLIGNLRGLQMLANLQAIRSSSLFIKIFNIELSPIGEASKLKDPWNGRWFREDHCKGPGNVFFVTASGDVKPCCGYANDLNIFTIGNIRKDSPEKILKNFSKNRHLYTIFNSGLSRMRERLEKLGIAFPGKTSSHCYFCHYILTEVPKCVLEKCLS